MAKIVHLETGEIRDRDGDVPEGFVAAGSLKTNDWLRLVELREAQQESVDSKSLGALEEERKALSRQLQQAQQQLQSLRQSSSGKSCTVLGKDLTGPACMAAKNTLGIGVSDRVRVSKED